MQVMVVTMSSIEFVDIIDNSGGGTREPGEEVYSDQELGS